MTSHRHKRSLRYTVAALPQTYNANKLPTRTSCLPPQHNAQDGNKSKGAVIRSSSLSNGSTPCQKNEGKKIAHPGSGMT